MSDMEPILRGEIDSCSPSFDNNDSPTHLITPTDERGQAVAPGSPSAPDDRAWAAAFKINVIITVISVRVLPPRRTDVVADLLLSFVQLGWAEYAINGRR